MSMMNFVKMSCWCVWVHVWGYRISCFWSFSLSVWKSWYCWYYCSNHVLNAYYMIWYVFMLKSMEMIVLKMDFCEFWKIDEELMNLKIEPVFWNSLNVILNYVNIRWSL